MAERQLAVVNTTGEVIPVNQVSDWDDARREFIRKNFCGGAPDAIAATFLGLCERRRLSPEARHVYLVNRAGKNRDGSPKPPNWVIQTGIDGYRLIAARTERYAGSDEPVFEYNEDRTKIVRASVTVRKLVGGVVGSFTASARMDEYAAGSDVWNRMPHTMIAKCAEALALRKAFPEELSGMYTDVEMDQAETPVSVHSARHEAIQSGTVTVQDPDSGVLMITENQIKMIGAVAEQIGMSWDQVKMMHGKSSAKELTRVEASNLITKLKAIQDDMPDDDDFDTGDLPPTQAEIMANPGRWTN